MKPPWVTTWRNISLKWQGSDLAELFAVSSDPALSGIRPLELEGASMRKTIGKIDDDTPQI
jgi:hypothetical protein